MHGYELALVLHLAGVLALFGGMTLVLTGMAGARRSNSIAGIREWATMAARLSIITPIFGVLAFIPAAYMVSDSKQYHWKDSWINVAIDSLVLIVIILIAIVLPRLRRLARVAAAEPPDAPPAALAPAVYDPILWLGAQLATTLFSGVVVLMVFKPDGRGTGAVIAISILLGLLATAPAFARYRRVTRQ
ncbi:MAG TPA: hypothetical protein VIO16_11715 [Dehalococcoidia bacterium]